MIAAYNQVKPPSMKLGCQGAGKSFVAAPATLFGGPGTRFRAVVGNTSVLAAIILSVSLSVMMALTAM